MEIKTCTRCKEEKPVSEFGIRTRKLAGGKTTTNLSIYCKSCVNKQAKQRRENDPEYMREYNRSPAGRIAAQKYREKNREAIRRRQHEYYLENINKFKAVSQTTKFKNNKRKYKQKRRNTDPVFRLRENISNAAYKALKKGASDKAGQSVFQHIGYTLGELKDHLEKQFDKNMTWANYGEYWHLDHIVPQSDLPYTNMEEENFKLCWSLKNLRPLSATQNSKDGASRIRHKKK